ncbi:copper resistance protein CopC [Paenibacillus sp. N4]|uniref:copper resistance CopC family protein n=1 Tax=Paenibacillus vietnamensis TaxID=2590547 RepID=UPI001CD09EB9|nr:copper resistance protein CopC [Paenibacillus vietnamensis]MCA0755230.1 copper resistance protein CopC [Paenibacillus vietnamensis]
MKRILLICLALIWLLPSAALAHSKMENAVPGQDATVTASPERIELTFNTKIEKLSNFKLLDAGGQQLETEKAVVEGEKMSGAVIKPLTNGIYTVKWTIIGADGHSVEGSYTFTVDVPDAAVEPTQAPDAVTETEAPQTTDAPAADSGPDQANDSAAEPLADQDGQSANYTPAIIIGAIIVAAALILFMRRRKP